MIFLSTNPVNLLIHFLNSYATSICVASCDRFYKKSTWSNYGSSVRIIAPGSNILGVSISDDRSWTTKSGTSMSSPMVAGVLAIFVGFEALNNDINSVKARLTANQLPNGVTGFDSTTTTYLLQSGINSPYKDPTVPYYGAPGRELKLVKEDVANATLAHIAAAITSTPTTVNSAVSIETSK